MTKSAKIQRAQRLFLNAMKEKFAAENPIETPQDLTQPITMPVLFETCPHCQGKGYRKGRSFCHRCGSTGKVRVKS